MATHFQGWQTYLQGDRAEWTGASAVLHGEVFYEVRMMEGHREGERLWTTAHEGHEPARD